MKQTIFLVFLFASASAGAFSQPESIHVTGSHLIEVGSGDMTLSHNFQ